MLDADNKNLEIKFGGDLHDIDVNILIESLINYSFVAQETAARLSPGSKLNIRIKAPREGSFILLLNLITESSQHLFTKENISLAADTCATVGGLYALRKWISKYGRPELLKPNEDDNSVEISNKNGHIILNQTVYNIYQDTPRIREKIRNTFAVLKEAEEITDFSIQDGDEPGKTIFSVQKEDFALLSSSDDEIEQKKQSVIRERQELSVFKVVFKEDHKWKFYYHGIEINAYIKDQDFFSKIEKGEIAFRSGDILIADLMIDQVFYEAANTFVNKAYHIIKVIKHIPRIPEIQEAFTFNKD